MFDAKTKSSLHEPILHHPDHMLIISSHDAMAARAELSLEGV